MDESVSIWISNDIAQGNDLEVETARTREIADLTDGRALEIIKSLALFAPVPPNLTNGLGLVEQRAIFHGRRKK